MVRLTHEQLGALRSDGADLLVPYQPIPNVRLAVAQGITFDVPTNAFAHTDPRAVVKLSASLIDGTPLPSVTFRPGTGGRAMDLDVPMPEGGGTVTGFGVTLEPVGGSPTPTLPVLYSASVSE